MVRFHDSGGDVQRARLQAGARSIAPPAPSRDGHQRDAWPLPPRPPTARPGRSIRAFRLLLTNLLFTVVFSGETAVYVPLWIQLHGRGGSLACASAMQLLAAPLALVGAGLHAWCVWDFAAQGGGTPHPIDAPKRMVDRGLYRGVRNPMYVGVLAVALSWAV